MYSFLEDVKSHPHLKAFAIIPKVGGSLSIIGSVFLIRDVILTMKEHSTIPLTTKIITLITVANLFMAFWEDFLSTWMVPADSLAFMAAGNITTCNFQGFISASAYMIVTTAYTMLSVLYYITVARKDWTTQKTRSMPAIFFFLIMPVIIGLGTAIPLYLTQQFNFNGMYSCNIAAYPLHCEWYEDIPCTRGTNASYILSVFFLYIIACVVFMIIFLVLLLCKVKKEAAKAVKCEYAAALGERRHPVASQALHYLGAFFFPNLASIISGVLYIFNKELSYKGVLIVVYIYAILWPLFGFLNSIVYFRLRYKSEKRNMPNASLTCLIGKTLSITPLSSLSAELDSIPPRISSSLIDDEDDLFGPLLRGESDTVSNNVIDPYASSATETTLTDNYVL